MSGMKFSVRLPFENYGKLYNVWAHEEEQFDLRKNIGRALRCTMSYAAEELIAYLNKLGFAAKASDDDADVVISLTAEEKEDETFDIKCSDNIISIHGHGRAGILYGVYELLEAQGIRWYSPDEEFVPKNTTFVFPESKTYVYDMNCGRGFDFEGPLKESPKLYIWMARNRMNLSVIRTNTLSLQRKLCMQLKAVGHIFEGILDPHNLTPDGKTFLEAHPDWYGKREGEITYQNALRVQFCMTNPELLEYLSEVLIERLNTVWKEADLVDIWAFDTWGNSCMCENCQRTGNGTDRTLHLLSHFRTAIDRAIKDGTLDHNVKMEFCYYEGTDTIKPPINAVPENLITSGDYGALAVILRCYAHNINDSDCQYNKIYSDNLEGITGKKTFPTFIREYYNVSKFEDLPVLFSKTMENDFRYYHSAGVRGMVYMHLPMLEWGVRTLTQYLYAQWCRDVNLDREALIKKYFKDLYGEYADRAMQAYDLVEQASTYSKSWRSWGSDCVLSKLLHWDGSKPTAPLFDDDHFNGNAVNLGIDAADKFQQAADILREIRTEEEQNIIIKTINYATAVNPIELAKQSQSVGIINRLNEDIRGLNYGADCFRLLALFYDYYNKLYLDANTEEVWAQIYTLANRMNEYTFAVKYMHPAVEIKCESALVRCQLNNVFYRALAARNKK